MTPEEARDATNVVNEMKKQMQGQDAQCQIFDVKQNGESVTFTMKCGVPQQFMFDISGVFNFVSSTRYTGMMKSAVTLGGKTTTTAKKSRRFALARASPAVRSKADVIVFRHGRACPGHPRLYGCCSGKRGCLA
jgi:hypothetical protein